MTTPFHPPAAATPAANRLTAVVQAIVADRLARDPQRFERILAEAEAAAWAEVTTAIKDAMKTAILAQLEANGAGLTLAPAPVPDPKPAAFCAVSAELTYADAPAPAHALAPDATETTTADTAHTAPAADGVGIYVYGVIAHGAATLPVIAGVADDTTVRLHPVGTLAAIVSDVPLAEFGQGALEAHLSDLAWLERSVRRHQAVQNQVLALAALAPTKFATIYLTSAGLEAWLAEQQTTLTVLLAALRNRQEWGLKVLVDRTVLAEHVATYSADVRELRAQMEGKTKGAAYFLIRRIQEVTAEEVERVSFDVADAVHRTLEQLSVVAVLNALPSEDIESGVQIVLNSAYLVPDAQVADVQAAVEAAAAEHGANGFTLQLSGPWPAYNFVGMAALVEEVGNGE